MRQKAFGFMITVSTHNLTVESAKKYEQVAPKERLTSKETPLECLSKYAKMT